MSRHKGHITISRPQYSDGRKLITVNLVDRMSGAECASLEIGYAEFAEALTGMGHIECEFEWRPQFVGLVREHKRETVRGISRKDVAVALAKHEIDGWKAYEPDATNRHRIVRHNDDGTHDAAVLFARYVEPPEADE